MFETLFENNLIAIWYNLLFNIFVKASIILTVPLIINTICKKSSAEFRHLLILISILTLTILPFLPEPIFTLKLAGFQPKIIHQNTNSLITQTPVFKAYFSNHDSKQEPTEVSNKYMGLKTNYKSGISYYLTIISSLLWLIGSCFIITFLLTGILGVYRIKKSMTPFSDREWEKTIKNLSLNLKFNCPIQLFIGAKFKIPFTFGITKPFIFLPQSFITWSPEQRYCVLLHELSHLKRGDTFTYLIARFIIALFWLNPLAWVALRLLRLTQEEACDDRVINYGVKPSNYASHLLDFLKEKRQAHPGAALGISSFKAIKSRIGQILNPNQRRSSLNLKMCLTALTIVFFLIISVTMFGPGVTAADGFNSNHKNNSISTSPEVNIGAKTEAKTLNFIKPVPITKISNPFGWGIDPLTKKSHFHSGIDIPLSIGTPVKASAAGQVVKAQLSGDYGILIIIVHENKFSTYYAKLSETLVKPGDQIKQGDIIGYSGNTGRSTGPHLHFEVHDQDRPIDPTLLF